MAIDFESLLTNDQKIELVNNRISQFAAEAYQVSLNKKTAESIGTEENINALNNTLTVLESAIAVHQEELDRLNKLTN